MESHEGILASLREAQELASQLDEPFQVPAFEVLARILIDGGPAPGAKARQADPGSSARDLPDSPNEFLVILQKRSHYDRFTALVWFYLTVHGRDGVTTDEILDAYSIAREKKPANASDVIANCIRKGHLMEGDRREGDKTWRVTRTGEAYIQALLKEGT